MQFLTTSRRRSRSSEDSIQSSTSTGNRITSEQVDIWEHVALLYHSYDWSNAVEAFRQLSIQINDVEAATLCALNAALIQANLGEFELAAAMVEQAARMDQDLIFTPYIMGMIEWELAHFIKAEACLDVCLRALRGGDISFRNLGLDFVLCSRNVRRQLSALKVDASGRFGPPTAIEAIIPAECIFEPPSRSRQRAWYKTSPCVSMTMKHDMLKRNDNTDVDRNTLVLRDHVRLAEGRPSTDTRLPPPSRSPARRSVRKPSPLRIVKQRLRSSAEETSRNSEFASQTGRTCQSIPPRQSGETWPRTTPKLFSPNREKAPWTARDAHGEYGSVSELASFIRKAHDGKTAAVAALQPRDATTHAASTKELAKFLKHAGKSRPLVPQADLDLVHDDEEEEKGGATPPVATIAVTERDSRSIRRGLGPKVKDGIEAALRPSSPATLASASIKQGSSQANTSWQSTSRPLSSTSSQRNHFCQPQMQVTNGDYFSPLPSTTYQPLPKTRGKIPPPVAPPPITSPPIPAPRVPPRPPQEPRVLSPPAAPSPTHRSHPPPWNIHTAASSTSSLYAESMRTLERQDVARDAALRMLEGRGRPSKQKVGLGRKAAKAASLSRHLMRHGRRGGDIAGAVETHINGIGRNLSVAAEATTMDSFAILGLGAAGSAPAGAYGAGAPAGGMRDRFDRVATVEAERKKGTAKPKKKWNWHRG